MITDMNAAGRRQLIVAIPLAVAVLAAVVAVSVWWARKDVDCSHAVSGRICVTHLNVKGAGGRLPTSEQLLAELPHGHQVVHEWHLLGSPGAPVTSVLADGRALDLYAT